MRQHLAEAAQVGRNGTALIRHGFAVPPSPKGKALVCEAIIYDTLTDLRMVLMAPFSRRETWAWEMPRVLATSIWVLPS